MQQDWESGKQEIEVSRKELEASREMLSEKEEHIKSLEETLMSKYFEADNVKGKRLSCDAAIQVNIGNTKDSSLAAIMAVDPVVVAAMKTDLADTKSKLQYMQKSNAENQRTIISLNEELRIVNEELQSARNSDNYRNEKNREISTLMLELQTENENLNIKIESLTLEIKQYRQKRNLASPTTPRSLNRKLSYSAKSGSQKNLLELEKECMNKSQQNTMETEKDKEIQNQSKPSRDSVGEDLLVDPVAGGGDLEVSDDLVSYHSQNEERVEFNKESSALKPVSPTLTTNTSISNEEVFADRVKSLESEKNLIDIECTTLKATVIKLEAQISEREMHIDTLTISSKQLTAEVESLTSFNRKLIEDVTEMSSHKLVNDQLIELQNLKIDELEKSKKDMTESMQLNNVSLEVMAHTLGTH